MNAPSPERNRCNCTALRKASRRLTQMYDAALASSGLKSTQFAILGEITWRADGPPTMRDLADALVMDHSTMGQNLRPLERDGLILVEQDPIDGRRRCVKLTAKGRLRFAKAQGPWKAAQERFESDLGSEEAAQLRPTLFKIAHDLPLNTAGNS